MRNIPTALVQSGSGQGRLWRQLCWARGDGKNTEGPPQWGGNRLFDMPMRSLRRAALGAMPEAMLPLFVGGGIREAGDTGAGKG